MPRKKYGSVRCHQCGERIRYKIDPKYVKRNALDPNRLIYIRRHYARKHPRVWRESIRRGVRKRARKR